VQFGGRGYGATAYGGATTGFNFITSEAWSDSAQGTRGTVTFTYPLSNTTSTALEFGNGRVLWLGANNGTDSSWPSWGTNGVLTATSTATYTDTSAAGTVAAAVASSFGIPTFAASNARTFTDFANVYVAGAPARGTNVTGGNPWSVWVDAGDVRLDGLIVAGSSSTTLTDSAGKILSAALNTVQPAQGGTGITSFGTGVATALGVNVGSAGAFVTFNGALGTPSSGTLTNCTFPTLNQNTSGTAANLSGTPALPNGTTATSQAVNDNSTKLATTLYADRAALKGNAASALTESSNATTIDCSLSNSFTLTLNANLNTVTFSNFSDGQVVIVSVTNTASNFTVTWGNSIKWVGGSQPVQTVGAKTDVWTFIKQGSTIYGNAVQNLS